MQNNCVELNNEFSFFQDLILNILTRRVIFKKFENEIKKTQLSGSNDLMLLIWNGYVLSQLSDCRKFFDKDSRAHSFEFIVRHIVDNDLKSVKDDLFNDWKNKKLETIMNQYMVHADKRVNGIKTDVSVDILDEFIDSLEKYLKNIVIDLTNNYLSIGSSDYDSYLKDEERDVDKFFQEIRK
jgi:hypothetical protein